VLPHPSIVLITLRFILRKLTLNDLKAHRDLTNDVTLARNASRVPFPYTVEAATQMLTIKMDGWEKGEEFAFGGFKDQTLIGHAGLRRLPEAWSLGYDVHRSYRGNAVACELAHAVCHFGFTTLAIDTIQAGHYVDNPASGRVLKKLEFYETGERSSIFSNGRGCKVDGIEYLLQKENFNESLFITDIDRPH